MGAGDQQDDAESEYRGNDDYVEGDDDYEYDGADNNDEDNNDDDVDDDNDDHDDHDDNHDDNHSDDINCDDCDDDVFVDDYNVVDDDVLQTTSLLPGST